jgi:hypothetical protein
MFNLKQLQLFIFIQAACFYSHINEWCDMFVVNFSIAIYLNGVFVYYTLPYT